MSEAVPGPAPGWRRWGAVLAAVLLAGCGGSAAQRSPSPEPTGTPAARADLAAVVARAGVPVLCYHQIRRATAGDRSDARPYIVAPAVLARQMRALARAGYHAVTGDELVAHVASGAPLPAKPVLLTFDDASAGQFSEALPILRRHGFVATFFVMTVVLDKPGWLTREQVRALDRAGMTIAAHTWDHSAVPAYTGSDWRRQIDEPTRELSKLVGHPIRLFAYPFGQWDAAAIPHLWEAGLRAAFQLAGALDRRHPLWNLRRMITPEWTGRRLLREIDRRF
jgi:peptidoglycan/xylan/chitin deacetylase (PgdA/CDA1 family)